MVKCDTFSKNINELMWYLSRSVRYYDAKQILLKALTLDEGEGLTIC